MRCSQDHRRQPLGEESGLCLSPPAPMAVRGGRYVVLSVAVPPVIAPVRNAICERVVKHGKQAGRQSLRYYSGAIPEATGQLPDGRLSAQSGAPTPILIAHE